MTQDLARTPTAHQHETRSVASVAAIYGLRQLGMYLVLPVLALHAAGLEGATPLLTGLSLGSYGLAQGLLQVPFGAWSDRYGRRRIIAAGLVVFALGSVLCAVAESAPVLVIGRTLQGAGAVASALVALIADLTRPHVRVRAMAALGAVIGLSFALGMVLGPGLAARFSVRSMFWLTAALSTLAALYIMVAIPKPRRGVHHVDAEWTGGQWRALVHDRTLMRLDAGTFLLHMSTTALFVVGPGLLARHVPPANHGTVYAFMMPLALAVMALSALHADRRGRLRDAIFGGAVLLVASAVALLLGADQFGFIVSAIGLTIGAVALAEPAMPAMLTRLSPAPMRGTAAGLFHMCQFIGSFVGGALGGLFLHRIETLAGILALSSIAWVVLAWGLPSLTPALPGDAESLAEGSEP